jgi:hypothetical protein
VAQLHLALPSPIASVEGQDEGKLADQLGQLHLLAFVIRQLDIGEAIADLKVHGRTSVKQ